MQTVLDIEVWASEVAVAEAAALREAVRDSLVDGAGLTEALALVRRRMRSLTPQQREIVVGSIDAASAERRLP
jgi:hypothetical protein